MGYNTSRQFRRVADDMIKYVNSAYVYNESNPVDDQWYDSHGTVRADVVKHKRKLHAAQSPILYPKHVPVPEKLTIGRRDGRQTSR